MAQRETKKGRSEYLCYTDGSCKAGDGTRTYGGWGYFIKTPAGTSIDRYGKERDTLAKVMEYRAVAEALEALPDDATATLFSDNQSLIENLSKRLADWRANGYAKVDQDIVASVRRIGTAIADKCLTVTFQWVRGHNGNSGNERADALAKQGAREAKSESS